MIEPRKKKGEDKIREENDQRGLRRDSDFEYVHLKTELDTKIP